MQIPQPPIPIPPTRPPSLPLPSSGCYDGQGNWDYGKCPEGPGVEAIPYGISSKGVGSIRSIQTVIPFGQVSLPKGIISSGRGIGGGSIPTPFPALASNEQLIGSTVFSKSRLAQVELALQKPSEAAAFASLVKGSGCPYGEIHISPIGGQPYSRCQSYEEFIAGYEV